MNHPSIVSVYDVGRHEEIRYLAMEYVDGPDLAKVLGGGRTWWAHLDSHAETLS